MHYHLSKILALSLKGKKHVSEAYTVRLLRAIHQCCIDNGSWDSASLLFPGKDPCERNLFGGTEAELEAIVSYREALKKLQKGNPSWAQEEKPGGGGAPKGDKKGDGKGEKGGNDDKDKKEATDGGVGL